MTNIRYSIPEALKNKVKISSYSSINRYGDVSSYSCTMAFSSADLYKTCTSRDILTLQRKVQSTLLIWDEKYKKILHKHHVESRAENVEDMNAELEDELEGLKNILAHTLDVDDSISWSALMRKDKFNETLNTTQKYPLKYSYIQLATDGKPIKFIPEEEPKAFSLSLDEFAEQQGFFFRLFNTKAAIKRKHQSMATASLESIEKVQKTNLERKEIFDKMADFYEKEKSDYEQRKSKFNEEKKRHNDKVEEFKMRHGQKEKSAVEEYCDLVLGESQYPDRLASNQRVEYKTESRLLVVEYDLPAPEKIPSVESYKYVKSQDKITEKKFRAGEARNLYESVIYQICIRTIHELFEADTVDAIDAIAFNGMVTNINAATGKEETKTIMSVQADKAEFMLFDLARVDPKTCFKHMKGVSAAALVDLAPINPVISMEKSDKRFVESRNVADNIDSSVNLASMHWEDFEHLVRELFEKEFAINGGEVKVTQASSDGGVDAIAFDPDPIRGGKIIIQAKRYTNVVSVSAVRDLYGTVMNEGATKGILVTTADYGADSYKFAKDKPITLLNGSHLLALLEKHGHKARINIKEARSA